MSNLSLIHSTQKAGPNTEIYGPRSEYGFLRTARRPIRMQDSSKHVIMNIIIFEITYIFGRILTSKLDKQRNELANLAKYVHLLGLRTFQVKISVTKY